MDEKISVCVKYSAEDFIRNWKLAESQKFTNKYGLFLSPAIFLLVFGLVAYQLAKCRVFLIGVIPVIAAGLVLYSVHKILTPLLMRRSASKLLKFYPELREEVRITFSNEGIEKSFELTKDLTKWKKYLEATETKTDFFFYVSDELSEFVPKRAFENELQQNQLKELVKSNLGEKAVYRESLN